LEDMAYFIQKFNIPDVQIPEHSIWIVVGGSYPGSLAAWMRLKYPSLVFASYSSSGPVRAKLAYFEYDLAVGDALAATSTDCAYSMVAAVNYVDGVLAKKDPNATLALKTRFGLQVVIDDRDFASALTDASSYAVQYGMAQWQNRICQFPKVDKSKPDGGVDAIIDAFGTFHKSWMTENKLNATSYNGNAVSIKLEDNTDGSRQWTWQTCTEFGYWQIAPPKPLRAVRSQLITQEYYEEGCAQSFGAANVPTHAFADLTNSAYGGDTIHVDRIAFANGELDPWRRLSVSAPDAPKRDSTPEQPVYVIKGTHHCDDLGASLPTDPPSATQVKQSINADFTRWLKEHDGDQWWTKA